MGSGECPTYALVLGGGKKLGGEVVCGVDRRCDYAL